jgi:predicted phosphodiesterase
MSRIAVLSDIHGNLPALEACVDDAKARGCDLFVNLGDILSGPLWPVETAAFLRPLDWPTIAGNHERQLLTQTRDQMGDSDRYADAVIGDSERAWLRSLPPTLVWRFDIFLCHGTLDSDLDYLLHDVGALGVEDAPPEAIASRIAGRPERLVLCGHTHSPRRVVLADGRTVANPGSVGLPAYDWDRPFNHVMETGTPDARYAIVDADTLDVDLIAVAYDHEAAARKAEAEGRDDWAIALRTGRAR